MGLNSGACERARAARILGAVTFHFNAARLGFLAEVLRSLAEFPVADILSVGIVCHVTCRFPPPRIVNQQSALNASASAE